MKLNDKEKLVLIGVLRDKKYLSEMVVQDHHQRRVALGAERLKKEYAKAGLVPMNLASWIGHQPTPSECVMFSRAYARLESIGLLDRLNPYGELRTSHLRLTPAGVDEARRLTHTAASGE